MPDATDDWFERYGPSQTRSVAPSASAADDWFEKYGPSQASPANAAAEPAPVPANAREAAWTQIPGHEGMQQRPPVDAPNQLGTDVSAAAGQIVPSIKRNFSAGVEQARQGIHELSQGDILPSGVHGVPSTTTTLSGNQVPATGLAVDKPGGALRALGGVAGALGSPYTGLTQPFEPIVDKATGVPGTGEKLAMLGPGGATKAVRSGLPAVTSATEALSQTPMVARSIAAAPKTRAAQEVLDLLGTPEAAAESLRRMEANPRLALMDTNETARTSAGNIAANPDAPIAQQKMHTAHEERVNARADNVSDAVEEALGPAPDVKATRDKLKASLGTVGKTEIDPVVKGIQQPIDIMPAVKIIEDKLGPEVMNAIRRKETPPGLGEPEQRMIALRRQLLGSLAAGDTKKAPTAMMASPSVNNTGVTLNPERAHWLQSEIRAEASELSASASGAERSLGNRVLYPVRQALVNAIDQAAGGKYKPALAKYRDANNVDEAFYKGFNVLKPGGLDDFPEYWRAWRADPKLSPQELEAAKEGARTAVRGTIEGYKNGARRGETAVEPEFVRDRFEALFGAKETERLQSLLKDARDMTTTNARLYQNSKTYTNMAAERRNRVRPATPEPGNASALSPTGLLTAGLSSGLGSYLLESGPGLYGSAAATAIGATWAAERGVKRALQYAGHKSDKARQGHLADLLSASSGPKRDEAMAILRRAAKPAPKAGPGSSKKLVNLVGSPLARAFQQ